MPVLVEKMDKPDFSRFELSFEDRTLPVLLRRRADELGDKPFVKFRDQSVSYVELTDLTHRSGHSVRR